MLLHIMATAFLLLALLSVAKATRDPQRTPFAYACEATEELQVIILLSDKYRMSNSTEYRACLETDQDAGRDDRRLTLTSGTKSWLPGSRTHLLITFKIPPKDMFCQFQYKWKVEEVTTSGSTDELVCSDLIPFDKCRVQIGRSEHCPHYPISSTPAECLLVPDNFTFLRTQCLHVGRTDAPPTTTTSGLPHGAKAGIGVAGLLAFLVLLGAALLTHLRPRSRPDAGRDASLAPSVFSLLASDRQICQFFKHRLAAARTKQFGGGGERSLTVHPDTWKLIDVSDD